MAKVIVEIELDNEAYAKEYGPGSEHWNKYHTRLIGYTEDGAPIKEPLSASEYKPLEGQLLNDAVVDILKEGFYDWQSAGRQWLKLTIDGKAVRQCCSTVEGDGHKDWCEKVAGPEASET